MLMSFLLQALVHDNHRHKLEIRTTHCGQVFPRGLHTHEEEQSKYMVIVNIVNVIVISIGA